MRDRISISKDRLKDLCEKKESEFELKDIEYEYYAIIVSTISYMSRDRKIFKRNKDLYEFINKVFNKEYKEYIQKNKSILIGKIINHVSNDIDKIEYEKYANILSKEINEIISPKKDSYIKFLQGNKK